jgi:hypothetical protein
MSPTIKPEELSETIMQGLEEYRNLSTEAMKEAVEKTAKEVKKEIQNRAPVKSGKYKRSWKISKTRESAEKLELTVHARRYQLTHLLEHGHAKRGGGRVSARPHIAPAESDGVRKLTDRISDALKKGS